MTIQISNYNDFLRYTGKRELPICHLCNQVLHEESFEYMDGNSTADETRTVGHALGCNGETYKFNEPPTHTKTQKEIEYDLQESFEYAKIRQAENW